MKIRLPVSLACLLFIIFAQEGFAYRPFSTEDAYILDPWQIELEIGHDYIRHGGRKRSNAGFYSLNAGLPFKSEINVAIPVIYQLRGKRTAAKPGEEDLRASGVGDLQLLAKINWIEESGRAPAFSPVLILYFPTGDASEGLGGTGPHYELLGSFSKSFRILTFHANAGYAFLRHDPDLIIYRAGADYKISDRFRLVFEADGGSDFRSATPNDRFGLLAGLILSVHPKGVFDFGTRVGLTSQDDPLRMTAGVTLFFD